MSVMQNDDIISQTFSEAYSTPSIITNFQSHNK